MEYKESKATITEVITTECPHCGSDYKEEDPRWRDKQDGSFAKCQKVACGQLFKLRF